MTIYKVTTGYETDYNGYATGKEIAQYFFKKEDAEVLYNKGKFTRKVVQITTTYASGYVGTSKTGYDKESYELRKANAKPNEIVELIEEEYNNYRMEEVEVH